MEKEIIINLLNEGAFDRFYDFKANFNDSTLSKKASVQVMNVNHINNGNFQLTCCFFFYDRDFLKERYMCTVTSTASMVTHVKISCYKYWCKDVGRDLEAWKWLDLNNLQSLN